MRIFKNRSIINLFWLNWIKNFENHKYMYLFLKWFFIITTIMFIWILIFILPFIYVGIRLKRNHSYTRLMNYFGKIKQKSNILYYFYRFLFLFGILITILMIFPIIIYILIGIGVFIQTKKMKIRVRYNPQNIDYQVQSNKKQPILYSKRLYSK